MLARMQWRIAIPYTLLIALCLLGLCAYLITFVSQLQLDAVRTRLAAEAILIGEVVAGDLAAAPPGALSPESLARIRSQVARLSRNVDARITIVDPRGVVLADSDQDPAQMENHANRPEVAAALANGSGEQSRFSATIGRDMLYVAATVVSGQQVVGIARVSMPLAAINASLNRIYLFIGAALIATTAIAVGLAVWIAGSVTRPLRHLTGAADLLARGSLRTSVVVEDRGEVGILGASFNRMARQLQLQVANLGRERDIFANVLTNMADGIIVVDQKGTVLVANDAARRPHPPSRRRW